MATLIATGVGKKVAYIKEVDFGTQPETLTSAKFLRRISSDIDMSAANFQSGRISSTYQVSDMRLGLRQVGGTLRDELSCASSKEFLAAALRKGWAVGGSTSASSDVGSTVGALGTQKFTRTAGNWLTDGFKRGDVIKCSGWSATTVDMTACNNRNYLVLSISSDGKSMFVDEVQQTAYALDASARSLATKAAAVDTVTVTTAGYRCFVPTSGHTNDSFMIEHNYSDITEAEQFFGCRVAGIDIGMPATGMATLDTRFMGQRMGTAAAVLGSADDPETTGSMAAVNGKLTYAGAETGLVTGATLRIECNASVGAVYGSFYSPDVFVGRVLVSGQFTAYFMNGDIRDDYVNEATPALSMVMASSNANAADVFVINLPKIKLGGATKSDTEQGLILTAPFTAVLQGDGGDGKEFEATTISIQDSTITS